MTSDTENAQVSVGDVVGGKYRVDSVLGQGGMGLVVAATHEQLDQRVALKFLLPGASANAEVVQRFLREARAAVKIHSEHVARVFDVGTHGTLPYMLMEYLEGKDIARVIAERGPLPVREAVGHLLEACDAVAEAHALGIVHRDLKPANLFLANRPSGKAIVKVLDFGISKTPVTDKDRALTNASAIMGSPSYMSPEQLVASASVDVRSDIWSLGVVLYEMLSGKLPFNAESMPELVGVILQGTFAPITTSQSDVPAEVQAIVDRCLQKDRERRFPSIAELARALAPFASSRYEALVERIESVLGVTPPPSSASRAPAAITSTASPSPSIDHRTLSPTTTGFTKKRQPLWLIAPVLALVLVAIAIFVTAARDKGDAPPRPTSAQGSVVTTSPSIVSNVAPIAPDPSSSSVQQQADTAMPSVTHTHVATHPSAHASASASSSVATTPIAPTPSASASPVCRTVSYFDDKGNKHFKLDCQ